VVNGSSDCTAAMNFGSQQQRLVREAAKAVEAPAAPASASKSGAYSTPYQKGNRGPYNGGSGYAGKPGGSNTPWKKSDYRDYKMTGSTTRPPYDPSKKPVITSSATWKGGARAAGSSPATKSPAEKPSKIKENKGEEKDDADAANGDEKAEDHNSDSDVQDLVAEAQKRAREPRYTFRETHLLSAQGLYVLYEEGQRRAAAQEKAKKPTDEGKEDTPDTAHLAATMASISNMYSFWAHSLFPKLHHSDVLTRVSSWSGKAIVKVCSI
jgi:hypothetical protein